MTAPPVRPEPELTPPSWREALPRLLLRLAVIVAIAMAATYLMHAVMGLTDHLSADDQRNMRTAILIGALAVYAILMALPFMPGIEIGVSLLMLQGADIAPFVYGATLAGLLVSFAVGRLVPIRALHRLFLDLHMVRAAEMIDAVAPLSPPERLDFLRTLLPPRIADAVLTYRYLGLGLLLNMPGSGLIGGGGGLCLLAGLTRVFSPGTTLLTLAIAISPFPILVWFAGDTGWLPWLPA